MNMIPRLVIQFKLLHQGATLPKRGTSGSGAFDIAAPESGVIGPLERKLISTGLAHQIHAEAETPYFKLNGLLISRSGLASNKGIKLFFDPCLIDTDYRGEIKLLLENCTDVPFSWNQGDRLCQIAYMPFFMGECEETFVLEATDRGEGGFGHTGVA